jgi:hypothetical protein
MRFIGLALLAALGTATLSAPAVAGPFAEVGDWQLRQDVETLHAAGFIRGPIDSWPLAWAQIDEGLNLAKDGRELDPYLKAAVTRLDILSARAAQRINIDLRVGATNDVAIARDFGTQARAVFDATGAVELNTDVVSIKAAVGYRYHDPVPGGPANYVNFDTAQVVVRLGGWALIGGLNEEWFGPGRDGALLWSNSARPMPKIGFKRLNPKPIDVPVLRWLGPVQFEMFGGILNGDRDDYDNIGIIGTRLSFSPARGLTIGLNRSQMLCGEGRPCKIWQSMIGFGNADNSTPDDQQAFLDQPGNQLAGWDISYVQRIGRHALKAYVEAEAEDFDNVILEQYLRLAGLSLAGPLGSKGASFVAGVEYANTEAQALFNGTKYPGSAYNNTLYFDGYTYRKRPIGYWTDGDSTNLAFTGSVTDLRNRRWYGSVRAVNLNFTNIGNPPRVAAGPDGIPRGEISYRVSANNEKFAILTAGTELPTRYGDIRLEARFQTDSPNTPGYRDQQAAIEVAFRQRF